MTRTRLFFLDHALAAEARTAGIDLRFRLGDITDERFMESLFASTKPQVVFHAAAHKHVR